MNDTDELVPELMRRATDRLEQPDAAALVERGLRRGTQLRRRRTIGISIAAASAVVLAATSAVALRTMLPNEDLQVAGPSTPSAAAEPSPKPTPKATEKATEKPSNEPTGGPFRATGLGAIPTEKEALEALQALVPAGYKITDPRTWGDESFTSVRITVNDGNGATELSAHLAHNSVELRCPVELPGDCQRFPDGSVVQTRADTPEYSVGHPNDRGVISNNADLRNVDGLQVSLTNYNATAEKGKSPTRARPTFDIEELTAMAKDPRWQEAGTKLPVR